MIIVLIFVIEFFVRQTAAVTCSRQLSQRELVVTIVIQYIDSNLEDIRSLLIKLESLPHR